MISTKIELKNCLKIEESRYFLSKKLKIRERLLGSENYFLWKYLKWLRLEEYHYNSNHFFRFIYCLRIKNRYGRKINVCIPRNTLGEGAMIWHSGILINKEAKIGKNCQLHGDNCVGNKGRESKNAPFIGDNVDIGVGAKIIGEINIADNIKIGANATVVDSCNESGAVLVGIPARRIK